MPQPILRPFAQVGDKTVPPDSDNNGFVNFTNGYTQDYELNLAAGNPLAKAVERPIQNGLFNLITDNLQFLQDHGCQQFFTSAQRGGAGYPLMAQVALQTTAPTTWRLFVNRVEGNTNAPSLANLSGSGWEEVFLPSVERQFVPFPAGVPALGDPLAASLNANAVRTSTFNMNTLTTKQFFVVSTDTIAATASNMPIAIGDTQARAGFAEITAWTAASVNYVIQRYTTRLGVIFTRLLTGAAWSAWEQTARPVDVLRNVYSIASVLGTSVAARTDLSPKIAMTFTASDAMQTLRYIAPSTNASSFQIRVGSNTFPVVGMDLQPIPAGSIQSGALVEVIWGGFNWILVSATNSPQIGKDAVSPQHLVTKRQLDAVAAQILTFNDIYPVGSVALFSNATDPGVQFPGTVWAKLPDNVVLRTSGILAPLVVGGADSIVLNQNHIPSHTHSVNLVANTVGPWTEITDGAGAHNHTATVAQAGGHTHSASTGTAGAHNHTATTNSAGSHNHTATTSSAGSHSHTGSTDSAGAHTHIIDHAGSHTHNFPLTDDRSGTGRADGGNANSTDGSQNTLSAGDHTHPMQGAGAHIHLITTTTAGAHTHSLTTNTTGAHTHSLTTNTTGDHSHTVAVNAVGDHTHNTTLTAVAAHTHSVTIAAHGHSVVGNTGAYGQGVPDAVPTLPRFVSLAAWYRTA